MILVLCRYNVTGQKYNSAYFQSKVCNAVRLQVIAWLTICTLTKQQPAAAG